MRIKVEIEWSSPGDGDPLPVDKDGKIVTGFRWVMACGGKIESNIMNFGQESMFGVSGYVRLLGLTVAAAGSWIRRRSLK